MPKKGSKSMNTPKKGISKEENIIRGSFHQGDITVFKYPGRQCTANAVMAMCFMHIDNDTTTWTTDTIDQVLLNGERYYIECIETRKKISSHNENPEFLNVDDLKNFTNVHNICLEIKPSELTIYGYLTESRGDNLYTLEKGISLLFSDNNTKYGLLTCNGVSVAVCKIATNYIIFNSHSQGARGNTIAKDGKACLIFYKTAGALANMFNSCYLKTEETELDNFYTLTPITIVERGETVKTNEVPHIMERLNKVRLEKTPQKLDKAGKSAQNVSGFKIVRGTFNQGSYHFTSSSRGKQCTAMAISALCYTNRIHTSLWTSQTVDSVLQAGDVYYRKCIETRSDPRAGTRNSEYLTADDLHSIITVEDVDIGVDADYMNAMGGHLLGDNVRFYNLKTAMINFFQDPTTTYGLLTSNLYSLAVAKKYGKYLMFDSHNDRIIGTKDKSGPASLVIACTLDEIVDLFVYKYYTESENNLFQLTKVVINDLTANVITPSNDARVTPIGVEGTPTRNRADYMKQYYKDKTLSKSSSSKKRLRVTDDETQKKIESPSVKKICTNLFSTQEKQEHDQDIVAFPQPVLRQQVLPTYMMAKTRNNITPHNLGPMTLECGHCNAIFFSTETKKCCRQGLVKLEPLGECPPLLKNLLTGVHPNSTNFMKNIIKYNSALAFASLGAKQIDVGPGVPVYIIQGVVYHKLGDVTDTNQNRAGIPRFGELYFLNAAEANRYRLENQITNDCLPGLLQELDNLIREINPLAQMYMQLRHVVERFKVAAAETGNAIPDIELRFQEMRTRNLEKGRYNAPTDDEQIGAIFQGEDGNPPPPGQLRVYYRTNAPLQMRDIPRTNDLADALCYPLLFPRAERGWRIDLELQTNTKKRQRISMTEYYIYRVLAVRRNTFNPIISAGKLTQQFFVDNYVKIEGDRLHYIRTHQPQMRATEYVGLVDYLKTRAERRGRTVGKMLILPSTFQGGPRAMQQHYQDSMALVGKYGRPDFFITMTCNPSWNEITNNLEKHQLQSNRPDLISRVFHQKFNALLEDVTKMQVFGCVAAYVYAIEFQKRGLPHVHLLLTLEKEDKIRDSDTIDEYISAEIPKIEDDEQLHDVVTRHMIHGPCGVGFNLKSICMQDGKCKKFFPKQFTEETELDEGNFVKYRRRNDGTSVEVRCYKDVDNRYVVPYNGYLLKKYNCHINIEYCSSAGTIKYLHKYVHKGHDCADIVANITDDHDEIAQYLDMRYIGASEASWRMLGYSLHGNSHTIVRLHFHLPNAKYVYFAEGTEEQALQRSEGKKSMFEDWFELNKREPDANKFLYPELPYTYRFDQTKNLWIKRTRKTGVKVLPRMYTVSPAVPELFYLRLLLLKVCGAKSYVDLKTVDGTTCQTFKEACEKLGLLADDREWKLCMQQAVQISMAGQIRRLFVQLLCLNNVSYPLELYDEFKDAMSEDYVHRGLTRRDAEQRSLMRIKEILGHYKRKLSEFKMPDVLCEEDVELSQENSEMPEVNQQNVNMLNAEQRRLYDAVFSAVHDENQEQRLFYLDGSGGTGKTFLYNTILETLAWEKVKYVAVAWTGIAAILLRNGRTVHSTFRLPFDIKSTTTSSIKVDSPEAAELNEIKLIVWDEVPMAHVHAFNAVERLMRDVTGRPDIFGGKVVLAGGDFRQTLPVVPKGSRTTIIEACIQRSPIWQSFQLFRLDQNMRANVEERQFAEWLIQLGDGKLTVQIKSDLFRNKISIPAQCIVEDVITAVFGDVESYTLQVLRTMAGTAILCPTNETCANINDDILDRYPGTVKHYYSVDEIETEDEQEKANFTTEYLHSLKISGLPDHKLSLKKHTPIMLLRNIDIVSGLCNGTRLIVTDMMPNLIEAEISMGTHAGSKVLLPRMDLTSNMQTLPFILKRRQFPVKVCFAMTINKSQGQTFDKVGIYLPQPVFTHGQLYVAFSRVKSFSSVFVQVTDTKKQGRLLKNDETVFTDNIVFRNVLLNT